MTQRLCAVVPTYDNPLTVRGVVERIRAHVPDVIVVDDGSSDPGRLAVEALARDGLARAVRLERNSGKGAAVKAGLRAARDLGFTHALQVDADGQHDVDDVPRFLEASRANPAALVLGRPVFDASAPASRRRGRLISRFWTDIETGGRIIEDPLCGFRIYPLDAALRARARGDRMEFDPEIAVRMIWAGTPVVNLPTRVRYVPADEGGVSHFRMFRDNVRISWGHARLSTLALLRAVTGRRLHAWAAAPPLRWHDVSEKGGAFAIRLLVAVSTALGRRAGRIVLYAVAAWFVLLHPGVRRTSRDYLARMGLPSGLGGVYRHVLFFARVSLDRVFMAKGELGRFRLSFHGEEHLHAAARSGRGALVLVAHVGSFEVLRALAGPRDVPLHVLAYFRNARRITAALRALDPALEARVIAIRPEDPSFVLQAEEVVRRGEILATMADRIGLDGKSVTAPFLGAPARFPSGPWLLAAALGCPVLVGFGLHTPPDRYDLHCEPLADRVELPRGRRDAALAEWVARYAAVLEQYVRLSPYNWFNFYDFWSAE